MQTAPAPFVPPPPQNGYQPLSEAEIYAIKRQYLGLLPPQQVIDVCLTFEAHAPLHIKSSVWPYDIRAAIASIKAQRDQASQTQAPPEEDAPSKTPASDNSSREDTVECPPSSSPQSTPTPTQAGPSASAPPSQPVASTSQPAAPSSHYPHQPYYHPTYPHAPYYTSHATYPYPHSYPYSQPPAMYQVNQAGQPSLFTNTPFVHASHATSETPNIDDLPSYEEMIVEALLDSGNSEGCAPKSLFTWMAMHYPLQTNFRPSASQALQKAYKRGRLEKGSNGKYRLNENWEGGNTSRRTTRRPQTLTPTALGGPQPPAASSPFTHSPVGPHGTSSLQTRFPPSGQPPGYPLGYPYPGTSGSSQTSVSQDKSKTTSQKQAVDVVDHETGEGSDAWEAAQSILKAINFGQLFQISSEEKGGEASTSANILSQQATVGESDNPSSASRAMALEESAGGHTDGGKSVELNAEQRAALQAQLALLAAQLAELADVSEDELSYNLDVPSRSGVASDACRSQSLNEESGLGLGDDSDDDDNEDMVEISVPMASLAS